MRDKIQAQELKLSDLKAQRRQTPAKLTLKELPEAERFAQLKTEKKHFIDTIKLIAYRAERVPWRVKSVKPLPAMTMPGPCYGDSLSPQPIYAPTPLPRPLASNCTVSAAHCKTPLLHTSANFSPTPKPFSRPPISA